MKLRGFFHFSDLSKNAEVNSCINLLFSQKICKLLVYVCWFDWISLWIWCLWRFCDRPGYRQPLKQQLGGVKAMFLRLSVAVIVVVICMFLLMSAMSSSNSNSSSAEVLCFKLIVISLDYFYSFFSCLIWLELWWFS